ncbi:MAG: hypothetical protein V2A34_08780 [Lentisphaerota bacterium]
MRKILRWVFWLLVLALLATPHVLKQWVVPRLVRQGIRQELAKLWKGPITIQSLEFNYFKPIFLKGITLKDESGREWLRIRSIEIHLRNFPGLKPLVTEVIVDSPAANLFFENGACHPPSPMSRQEFIDYMLAPTPWADLQAFSLREGTITTINGEGRSWAFNNFRADATWQGALADFRVSRFSDEGDDRLNLMGKIDSGTAQINLMLAIAHVLDRKESASLLPSLGQKWISSAEGQLSANLRVAGSYRNWTNLNIFGTAGLNSLRGYHNEDFNHPVLNDGNVNIEMNGQNGRITSGNFDTDVWTVMLENLPLVINEKTKRAVLQVGGLNIRLFPNRRDNPFWGGLMKGVAAEGAVNLQGALEFPLTPQEHFQYHLQGSANFPMASLPFKNQLAISNLVAQQFTLTNGLFTSDNISFAMGGGTVMASAQLHRPPARSEVILQMNKVTMESISYALWPSSDRLRQGVITASCDAKAVIPVWTGVTAHVEMLVENAEINSSLLFSTLMKMLGQDPRKVQGGTDLAAVYDVNWPLFTLKSARLANKLTAFNVEPGGTINFDTDEVDCYIVAGVLSRFQWFLLKPFANMAQTLTRVHIKGLTTEPGDRLIHKAPIADLARGTYGFISDTIKTGGELGDSILQTLWMPFSANTNAPAAK